MMVYNSIKHTSDLRESFPGLGDFLMYPPVEGLIWDTPFEEELNADDLQPKLSEYLSSIIAKWKPAKIQELVEIMRKSGITRLRLLISSWLSRVFGAQIARRRCIIRRCFSIAALCAIRPIAALANGCGRGMGILQLGRWGLGWRIN
ncbi:hypothetical protein BDP27DRAFT_827296 [Rhodocollybia butyracea]|uniref:Uncharacterized protein n=1 Tax=Rhodocollybia butyracea TaxID=206335 RepID=A0A9P5P5N2_9AGAR|nr:hypothetical protein BDP27DRAFT_827296 [Rhodocollybia butyracea]